MVERDAGLPARRTVAGAEAAFVGKELDQRAGRVDQGNAVGRAVLDAGGIYYRSAETAALVGDGARQRQRGIARTVAAVVEHERPTTKTGAGRRKHFHAFAGIGAVVVVVDLVDEDIGAGGESRQAQETGEAGQDGGTTHGDAPC